MTDEDELMPDVADDRDERQTKTRKYEHAVDIPKQAERSSIELN